MLHIVYLATADARGHLMRAQLLVKALRKVGVAVEVLTTSDSGKHFLSAFDIDATVLSRHYAVQFDEHQNMLRKATDQNVARYVFHPMRMLRDIAQLHKRFRTADLVINDSFHPALLVMGTIPGWRRRIVHIYGRSLRAALTSNFEGRLPRMLAGSFAQIIDWQIDMARCSLEHDFAYCLADHSAESESRFQLPTPLPVAKELPAAEPSKMTAAVYLNPHFRNIALADALSAGVRAAGLDAYRVGEGYAGHDGWIDIDTDWATHAAHAALIISAPGMAALSIALVYRRPLLLVLTDQPEQASNAKRAAQLQLIHRIVTWRNDALAFEHDVKAAITDLMYSPGTRADTRIGRKHAQARIDRWVSQLIALCP